MDEKRFDLEALRKAGTKVGAFCRDRSREASEQLKVIQSMEDIRDAVTTIITGGQVLADAEARAAEISRQTTAAEKTLGEINKAIEENKPKLRTMQAELRKLDERSTELDTREAGLMAREQSVETREQELDQFSAKIRRVK